jgi:hypothetical protein
MRLKTQKVRESVLPRSTACHGPFWLLRCNDASGTNLDRFRPLLISLAGCLHQHQPDVIDYLQKNRVLREQLGNKRLRLNDDQHRRLAKAVG